MAKDKDFEKPILSGDATLLAKGYYEILHSEYRDENVKNKFYGYVYFLDYSGNSDEYSTTDDFDTKEEALEAIKKTFKSRTSKTVLTSFEDIN